MNEWTKTYEQNMLVGSGEGILIEGLHSYQGYDVSYHPTRLDALPPNFPSASYYHYTSDGDGKILLAECNSFLGCDTSHADIAFALIEGPPQGQRLASPQVQTKSVTTDFDCSIYPNPSTGMFQIQLKGIATDNTSLTKINIYDVTGRLIYSTSLLSASTNINLKQLPKGCYFLTAENNHCKKFKKIIIQ